MVTNINLYHNSDKLTVVRYGIEQCVPLKSYGPAIRDHYLFVVVLSGKGIFRNETGEYTLGKHDVFYIRPRELHFYQADAANPWHYAWIGFKGEYSLNKYLDKSILRCDNLDLIKNCAEILDQSRKLKVSSNIRISGCLNLFLSEIYESNFSSSINMDDLNEFHVSRAIRYIEGNYEKKITVSEVASFVYLSRTYFTYIFKEYTRVSPQEFIIDYKIKKACQFLTETNLSIAEIANSVGYQDQLNFSRLFKKKIGKSPRGFREDFLKHQEENPG